MMEIPFPNNAFVLIVIPLIFNLIWIKKLPAVYSDDAQVSKWILWLERAFRLTAFFYPLLLPFHLNTPNQITGLAIYSFGLCLYLFSWLIQVYSAESEWSQSLWGFLAPAYMPLIWLSGIAIIAGSWCYEIIVLFFSGIHVYHNWLIYRNVT